MRSRFLSLCLVALVGCAHYALSTTPRYQIVAGTDGVMVLLDQQTGETWQKATPVYVPNGQFARPFWSKMNYKATSFNSDFDEPAAPD